MTKTKKKIVDSIVRRLIKLGAKPDHMDNPNGLRSLEIMTKYGNLTIMPSDSGIFTRFKEVPEAGRNFLSSEFHGNSLNGFSGKWNFMIDVTKRNELNLAFECIQEIL